MFRIVPWISVTPRTQTWVSGFSEQSFLKTTRFSEGPVLFFLFSFFKEWSIKSFCSASTACYKDICHTKKKASFSSSLNSSYQGLGPWKVFPRAPWNSKKETKLELIKCVITVDCSKHASFRSDLWCRGVIVFATHDSIVYVFRKLGPLSRPWEYDLEAGFKGVGVGLQWISTKGIFMLYTKTQMGPSCALHSLKGLPFCPDTSLPSRVLSKSC